MMARHRIAALLLTGLVAVAACGGGDDDDSATPFEGVGDAADQSGSDAGGDGGNGADPGDAGDGGGAPTALGDVTLDADPLSAWVEVDGQRFEYRASGTVSFQCTIEADSVRVNIQTPEDFFTMNGIINQGDWIFTLSIDPPGDVNAVYGGTPLTTTGSVGLDATSMSYVGEIERVTDFDIANAESLQAEFAVNCEPPGPDPTAEIGDAVFTTPFDGATGLRCDVSEQDVDISVQQQIPGFVQLSLSATNDGSAWLGSASISGDDGRLGSTIPADGTGLTIDGNTVTYEGVFETPTGDADGTVTVTCP